MLNRMATDLPPAPDSTIDVSGLPEPVVRVVRELVETLRGNLTAQPPVRAGGSRRPLAGRLEHLNLKVPTFDEFQAARRETWANFPRDLPEPAPG
jgi:hypothetical protein